MVITMLKTVAPRMKNKVFVFLLMFVTSRALFWFK
jgi:hypothetical protein